MRERRTHWRTVAALTAAGCLGLAALGSAEFTSYGDRSRAIVEGNWQSCREADGQFSERVYDGKASGIGRFELHMGPYHEFALFRGVEEGHRDHDSPDNLLRPYSVTVRNNVGRQKWWIPGLLLEVTLAGGARDDCESWFVTLRKTGVPASD